MDPIDSDEYVAAALHTAIAATAPITEDVAAAEDATAADAITEDVAAAIAGYATTATAGYATTATAGDEAEATAVDEADAEDGDEAEDASKAEAAAPASTWQQWTNTALVCGGGAILLGVAVWALRRSSARK
jgi:hypothetical protein